MNRYFTILTIAILSCFNVLFAQEFNPPFFVFEDGLWNAKSDEASYWSNLVKDTGFDGIELIGLDKVDAMIPALKKTTSNFLHYIFKSILILKSHTMRG